MKGTSITVHSSTRYDVGIAEAPVGCSQSIKTFPSENNVSPRNYDIKCNASAPLNVEN